MKPAITCCLILCLAIPATAQTALTDSLLRVVAQQKHDTTEVEALLNLTYAYLRQDFAKAAEFNYRALTLSRKLNHTVKIGGAYTYLITIHQTSGRLDSAAFYLDQLEKLSVKHPTLTKIQVSFNQMAGLYYKNQGNYKKALPYMLETLRLSPGETEARAGQLLNIGNNYFNLGENRNAVNYHLQSLKMFEKLKNKRGQSFCLNGLGNDFLSLNQYKQSRSYFAQSLAIKTELKDKRGLVTASNGLGDAYLGLGEFALAEQYFMDAMKGAAEMKLVAEDARAQFSLGMLYKKMGDIDRARVRVLQGLALARSAGDSTLSARINAERIALDLLEQKERGTELTLLGNLNTMINAGDRAGQAMEYHRLSQYYAERKQYDKAYAYLQKHEALSDSVEGKEVLLQMRQLEEQFLSEKKEREIALLKKDQELSALALSRERTNMILITTALLSVIIIGGLLVNRYRIMNRARREIELEKVRNHIARDLHDDIGSTLSSINIMSQLALSEDPDKHLRQITQHSAQMMENMSDIVWSINPRNDSIDQVVLKMKEFASEILEPRGIEFDFDTDPSISQTKLSSENRKNLFLLYKEAINNAAKYSGATRVTIGLSVRQETFHFSVHDNGTGFDPERVKHGNGLLNMKERAATMNGKFTHTSKVGEGTQMRLEIPIT